MKWILILAALYGKYMRSKWCDRRIAPFIHLRIVWSSGLSDQDKGEYGNESGEKFCIKGTTVKSLKLSEVHNLEDKRIIR